jgi:hypothetical protein
LTWQIGDFNADDLEFASEEGQIFHLPRDNHCDIVYCNAEGIQWIDHYRVVVASDKAKSDQPFWCALPPGSWSGSLPACLPACLPASLAIPATGLACCARHALALCHSGGPPAPALPCPPLPCRCDAKDQMIHLFAMPPTWDPYTPAAQAKARWAGERSAAEL